MKTIAELRAEMTARKKAQQHAAAIARMSADTPDQPAKLVKNENVATDRQIAYLVKLGVVIPNGFSKLDASRLIDAAKIGDVESVGGAFTDGSY